MERCSRDGGSGASPAPLSSAWPSAPSSQLQRAGHHRVEGQAIHAGPQGQVIHSIGMEGRDATAGQETMAGRMGQ